MATRAGSPGWALYAMPHHPPLVEGSAAECLEWMVRQPIPYTVKEAPSCSA